MLVKSVIRFAVYVKSIFGMVLSVFELIPNVKNLTPETAAHGTRLGVTIQTSYILKNTFDSEKFRYVYRNKHFSPPILVL